MLKVVVGRCCINITTQCSIFLGKINGKMYCSYFCYVLTLSLRNVGGIRTNDVHHSFKFREACVALSLKNRVKIGPPLHLFPEPTDCGRKCCAKLWRPNEKVARDAHEGHDVMDDIHTIIYVARLLELSKERREEIEQNRLKGCHMLWRRRLGSETRRATELCGHSEGVGEGTFYTRSRGLQFFQDKSIEKSCS